MTCKDCCRCNHESKSPSLIFVFLFIFVSFIGLGLGWIMDNYLTMGVSCFGFFMAFVLVMIREMF